MGRLDGFPENNPNQNTEMEGWGSTRELSEKLTIIRKNEKEKCCRTKLAAWVRND